MIYEYDEKSDDKNELGKGLMVMLGNYGDDEMTSFGALCGSAFSWKERGWGRKMVERDEDDTEPYVYMTYVLERVLIAMKNNTPLPSDLIRRDFTALPRRKHGTTTR